MTDDAEKGAVHWLAPPARLAEVEDLLRRALFSVLGVADASRHVVTVSPTSGVLRYVDLASRDPKRLPPELPRTPADASRTAERFLRDLGQAVASLRRDFPDEIRDAAIVPGVKPYQPVVIPRPDYDGWDHWLYRARPHLALSPGRQVPVEGALLEVRIGNGGRVVSYTALWQPTTGRFQTPLRGPPVLPDDGEGHSDRHGEKDAPPATRLAYTWGGEGIPQYYLAPYHVVSTGHQEGVASGSAYSLTLDVMWRQLDRTQTEVLAVVDGGSGRYDFAFASYRPGELLDEEGGGVVILRPSVRTLRTEAGDAIDAGYVTVPNGLTVVLVNVRDRRNGAFLHGQQQVVSVPVLDVEPGRSLVS